MVEGVTRWVELDPHWQGMPYFSTNWDGLIIWSEMLCRFYESPKALPRWNNKWIQVDPSLMRGAMKFFKPKHTKKTTGAGSYHWSGASW